MAALRVLLAGGGSGGSSAPVLAIAQELRARRECQFLYVGTASGPERELVERMEIPFRTVQTGKLRRYWSAHNLLDLVRLPIGILQSLAMAMAFRPDVAFAAGGFAAVPPLLACALLRVPVVIHQQDVEPGLANRILAPFAAGITATFPQSRAHFPSAKTKLTGNPVRREILAGSRAEAMRLFDLQGDLPVVLATGGGTGAAGLNRLIRQAIAKLTSDCQLVHITGRGKSVEVRDGASRYRQVEFLADGMAHALAAADLVIGRAGLSTLTEVAALGKPSILIPMPGSHQIANARVFQEAGAALAFDEASLGPEQLVAEVRDLLKAPNRLDQMGARARALMPSGAESRIADELERVIR